MQGRKNFKAKIYYNINLDSMIPEGHLLKKLDSLISFEFVRDKTKNYYSYTGKPSIDPVVLVKMLLIGYLFNIRSERKLVEDISLNLAYRWYIGYDLDEEIPDHSIFSKARARFGKTIFTEIFEGILKLAIGYGLVSTKGMLVDSTIIKANASLNSMVEVDLSPEEYWRKLDESETKQRQEAKPKEDISQQVGTHFDGKVDKSKIGKRRRARNASYLKKRSTTDPDATLFYRPGMGSYLSYKAQIASSLEGFITAACATPSSTHDTASVPVLLESHENILGRPSWICADTKYGSEECLKYLQDKGIKTSINPETKSNRPKYFSKEKFIYDKDKDLYICPQGNILERKAKNHKLNRITYKAKKQDCLPCPLREKCIDSVSNNPRIITSYDSQCYQNARGWYHSKFGKNLQKLRSTILEGIVGQAKEYHFMDKAKFRGINKVEMQILLTATAINLKKMVKMVDNSPIFKAFYNIFDYFIKNIYIIFKKLKKELVILRA